ncbi:FliA/WhiG family RNA polymerase sigma factor [Sphingomonadaceae bacterium LXI357]|uniref:FliA/WhiG family RNA polymerase sigma factor n=2 Tax=Stakelama marina TaxID=2826939 RepID=A0A8T4IJ40_9SPHN|nr:FliA/WhiG family RNA polymerase sigma factor [Stakelama marina]MBR0553125.1 FliA/WhiG family RNA polymerase sigma factor [Stakelama marina]
MNMMHAKFTAADAYTYDRAGHSHRDADAMAREHLPLVRRIAWHIHGSMSGIVEVEDLIQIGLVALVEAVATFEDRGQVTFEQYLSTRLRGAMIDELRRQATLTRGAMQRKRVYARTVEQLSRDLDRVPTDEEVAAKLGVTTEKLRIEYASAEPLRFDPIEDVYTDEGPWFMDDAPDAFEQLADADIRDALVDAIGALPEREAQVIQLYYVEELNLEEIGQVIGVGAARVCQIKKSAHDRLKRGLQRRFG